MKNNIIFSIFLPIIAFFKIGNLRQGKTGPVIRFNYDGKEKGLIKTNCSYLSDIIHVKVSKYTKRLHPFMFRCVPLQSAFVSYIYVIGLFIASSE